MCEVPGSPGKTIGSSGRLWDNGHFTSQPPLLEDEATVGAGVGGLPTVGVAAGGSCVGVRVGVFVGDAVVLVAVGVDGSGVGVAVGVGGTGVFVGVGGTGVSV